MAGVRGRSGGVRLNAGRKSRPLEEYQESMRERTRNGVTVEDWDYVVQVAIAQAKSGNKEARDWLSGWIVGKTTDKVEIAQKTDATVRVEVHHVRREIDPRRTAGAAPGAGAGSG